MAVKTHTYPKHTHTHQSEIEFPKDIPPTSCQKFESGVPSGRPPFLSFFPSPHLSSSIPPTPFVSGSSSLLNSLVFVCWSQISLKNPRNHCFNISLRSAPPLRGPHSSSSNLSFLRHSQPLCLCVEGVKHKLSAYLGLKAKGHWSWPPTHGAPTQGLSRCVCACAQPSCLSFCMHVSVLLLTGVCLCLCTGVCLSGCAFHTDLCISVCIYLSLQVCACTNMRVRLYTLPVKWPPPTKHSHMNLRWSVNSHSVAQTAHLHTHHMSTHIFSY